MELDGTLAGSPYLVDGARYLRIPDICLIGSVIKNQRIVLQRVVDPLAQLLLGDDRSRGVVRITQIDDIHVPVLGDGRCETILCRAGHIDNIRPAAILKGAAASYHYIRVNIDGVDRVGYPDEVIPVEHLLDIARI